MATISHGTLSGYFAKRCRCDSCSDAARAYNRRKRAERKANPTPCSVDGCDKGRAPEGGDLCSAHRSRLKRSGSVGSVATRTRGGDDITYEGAHIRLRKARGKARTHQCVRCGEQAREWAYIHGSPDERPAGSRADGKPNGPWSLNPDHYEPLCALCHRNVDWDVRKPGRKVAA